MAIDTVLLAIGPDEADRIDRLTEETIELAEPNDATVVIAHVLDQDAYDELAVKLGFDPDNGEVFPTDVVRRHSLIRELTDELEAAGIDVEIRGAVGDRGDQIVRLASEVGADSVVVGGRRRSPTGKAVFGSVAQEVMLSSPCPVTFVRNDTL
ncbi:universal stress protein UspA [Halalkaliarchaeum desulfuricum]|uniref:Universal stress protein UspA n=1 Tax=Halalkaliarchaeum desulfuricum TaxID=2055893 RepID=A0A343TP25_9EURY|nr:universal stress protein [Halalkaliarchaeum desulfuricum]AUX10847.1 universal stress protein UspA [Halalkaliarchaeum desulfuricum]